MKSINKIILSLLILFIEFFAQIDSSNNLNEWEVFPIVNYDTDVGFGYGVKGFFYNFLNKNGSFDVTIYNSTKGERWYQLIYSSPDIMRRQGTKYDFAFDLLVDYDKYINFKYYRQIDDYSFRFDELGNIIELKNSEEYIREPIEVKAIISKAFTTDFITEVGISYRSISCYGFEEDGTLKFVKPSKVEYFSLLFNFRIDTRENFINPRKGILARINTDYSLATSPSDNNFLNLGFTLQVYTHIIYCEIISATRLSLQVGGNDDYQNMLALGGNNSARGLPQSRYLSNSMVLLNEEIRFPIWKRIGGILGVDIGNSYSTPDWIINPVVGLRYYMDNFIVRFDVGFSKELTGIYFNFGHIF